MAEKNSFILHTKYGSIFADMSDKQAGALIKAIFKYIAAGDVTEGLNDVEVKTAFKFIKLDLDYNNAKYTELCAKRSEWGKRGARSKTSISQHKPVYAKSESISQHNDVVVDVDVDIEKEKLKKEKGASLPSFEDFWKAYPKKTTKKECQDWWKKNADKRQAAIDGLDFYKRNTDPQYYLDPIRYLKRERWLDKPECWQENTAAAVPKAEEAVLSPEELAEKKRWDSLTEAQRKAELDSILERG